MKVNIPGFNITDEDRKKIKESAFGSTGYATRKDVRDLATQAVAEAFKNHGVEVAFAAAPAGEDN